MLADRPTLGAVGEPLATIINIDIKSEKSEKRSEKRSEKCRGVQNVLVNKYQTYIHSSTAYSPLVR